MRSADVEANCRELLQKGALALEISLSEAQQDQLIGYLHLLSKWNQAYNLTAIRDPEEMVVRHILDSLSIVPYLHGKRCLDVGTGAGLPGIILAIALPQTQWVLIDSNGKKTRFVSQVIAELGLTQVTAVQTRVERYQTTQLFDTITTRAFSDIPDILDKTQHLIDQNGVVLAMKGTYPKQELQNVSDHGTVHSIQVPFIDEERHIVCITGKSRG